jgi:hypothetical protein
MTSYQSIIPSGSSYSRQSIGTPSEGDYSNANGNSPPRGSLYEQHIAETQFSPRIPQQQKPQQQQEELTARFIPGQGIQYVHPQQQKHHQHQQHHGNNTQYVRARAPSYSSSNSMQSPISPGTRAINPQQPPYYPQTQRRLSDAQRHQPPTPSGAHQPNFAELGKGVPLSAVPSSWPLFIVEFKAGRTDLFYLTDLSQDIRIGDFVIVEADRGKDLGKVVNDSITLAEVEEFQRQQLERGFGGGSGGTDVNGQPTSPGGSAAGPGGKKEINPKMMYKKATQQDLQCVFFIKKNSLVI